MNQKKFFFVLFFGVFLCLVCHQVLFAGGWDNLNKRKGAEAMVCVTVVDADGKPVKDAPVKGYFYLYTRGAVNHDTALTDAEGKASVKGMCSSYDLIVELKKEGYYTTEENIDMLGKDYPGDGIVGVKKDKWQPYGIQKTYVFKEIRNPVPMVVFNNSTLAAPELDREYGYDLEYGSFVEPYGDGKVADFYVKYTWDERERKEKPGVLNTITLTIRFPNEKDGAYAFPMDVFSQFKSPYRADPDAEYARELVYSSVWEKDEEGVDELVQHTAMLPKSQGLVLRTRSVVDATGTLVSAHYSKIYGGIHLDLGTRGRKRYGIGERTGDRITTFYNPVENDTNLECDGKVHDELQKGKRYNERWGILMAL